MSDRGLQCLIEELMAAQAAAGGHEANECREHSALFIGPDLFSEVFLRPGGEFFRCEGGESTVVADANELPAVREYAVRKYPQLAAYFQ